MALQSPAHEPIKKLESKSFPRPFSMPTQQCHDNTIGCDSRFRSNITLADANPPGSRVNNTPFRHQVDSQECLQPPDPASHHIAARNEISSQLVWSTSISGLFSRPNSQYGGRVRGFVGRLLVCREFGSTSSFSVLHGRCAIALNSLGALRCLALIILNNKLR